MAEILQLPPQEEPKRQTAVYRPKNLYEHFMAFMCVNNQRGFTGKDKVTSEAIATIIQQYAENKTTTLEHFVSVTHDLKAMFLELNLPRAIHLNQIRVFLARVFGYADFKHLVSKNELGVPGEELNLYKPFPNLRGEASLSRFFEVKGEKTNPYYDELVKFVEGFDVNAPRPEFDPGTVEGVLTRACWKHWISKEQLTKDARQIKIISEGKISHSQALHLIAKGFGYKHHTEAMHSRSDKERELGREGTIANIRKNPEVQDGQ